MGVALELSCAAAVKDLVSFRYSLIRQVQELLNKEW